MQMYKDDLGLLNHRYGEFELRILLYFAETNCEYFLIGSGADISLLNSVKDGLVWPLSVKHGTYDLVRTDGKKWSFPMTHSYEVTAKGRDFVRRFKEGDDLS